MSNETEQLLSVHELATRLGVKPTWVYRHARELKAYRLGKYVRFSWNEVLLALKSFQSFKSPKGEEAAIQGFREIS